MDIPPSGTVPPPPRAKDASGILAVRTRFMKKRGARRKLPRPGAGTLLFLFILVGVVGALAAVHRKALERDFAARVTLSRTTPDEIKRIRHELSDLELNEKELANALDARLKYLAAAKRNEFYIAIDTKKRGFSFHFADKTLRDAPVEVGPPRTILGGKRKWTFAALTGAFSVGNKYEGGGWTVPEWVYRMNGTNPPKSPPTIRNGLGRYVIVLENQYVIHSPPPPDSPLKGAKPGSFMVPEADLAAIWKRVGPETRVYVF
ncbi:MAG: L,D-transpeptidase [Acidobacteriota bacterium]